VLVPFQDDGVHVARHADAVLDLAHARYGDEFFYQSLPLCVLDAVFSIGIRYQVVRNVVARYCAHAGVKEFRPYSSAAPARSEQESITSFCERLGSWGTADQVAARLGSRQRTSTHPTSSILKADAALRFAEQLRAHAIEHLQDMAALSAEKAAQVTRAICVIPGQDSGISWAYFQMLAGTEDLVKPDRMLQRFIQTAVGRDISSVAVTDIVRSAARHLRVSYPHLSPRLLDNEIWKYQSGDTSR